MMGKGLQNQILGNGHAKMAPQKCHDQRIVPKAVTDLRLHRTGIDQMLDIITAARRFDDKRILKQLLQCNAVFCFQRMTFGKNRAERIMKQR